MLCIAWPNDSRLEGWIDRSARCVARLAHTAPSDTKAVLLALAAFSTGIAVIRIGACYRRIRAQRATVERHHCEVLTLLAYPSDFDGVVVLDHPLALAYSVAGSPPRIVITAGLLERLSAEEVQAVVEHERAHLMRRHHLVAGICELLAASAPAVPVFRRAPVMISALLECDADRIAARATSRRSVRSALISMRYVTARGADSAGGVAGHTAAYQRRLRDLATARPRAAVMQYAACVCLPMAVAAVIAACAAVSIVTAVHLGLS